MKLYGYVRYINGVLHVQSKNAIQIQPDGTIYHFKPNSCRYFKSRLDTNGQIFKLV